MILRAARSKRILIYIILLFYFIIFFIGTAFNFEAAILLFLIMFIPISPFVIIILRFKLTIFPDRIEIQRALHQEIYKLDQIKQVKSGKPRLSYYAKRFSWMTIVLFDGTEKTLVLDMLAVTDRDIVIKHILNYIGQKLTPDLYAINFGWRIR